MPQHPAFAEGRTAVITGGASGIGLAAAKRFAAFGMKICLADLSQEALDRAAEQLSAASSRSRECSKPLRSPKNVTVDLNTPRRQ